MSAPGTIDFKCPRCEKIITALLSIRGSSMPCPHCKRAIIVPFTGMVQRSFDQSELSDASHRSVDASSAIEHVERQRFLRAAAVLCGACQLLGVVTIIAAFAAFVLGWGRIGDMGGRLMVLGGSLLGGAAGYVVFQSGAWISGFSYFHARPAEKRS